MNSFLTSGVDPEQSESGVGNFFPEALSMLGFKEKEKNMKTIIWVFIQPLKCLMDIQLKPFLVCDQQAVR